MRLSVAFVAALFAALPVLPGCTSEPEAPASVLPPNGAATGPDSTGLAAEEAPTEEAFTPASPPPDSVLVGDPPTRVPGPYRALPDGWTTGTVDVDRPDAAMGVLQALRVARQESFDRAVFEFGGPVPGFHVEYVDAPVYTCGEGRALRPEGDGWLRVSFGPAQAHTDEGQPTLTARRQLPALPTVREVVLTCDFEGEVTVVLGVAAPNAYRLLELTDPHRLVVDVRH